MGFLGRKRNKSFPLDLSLGNKHIHLCMEIFLWGLNYMGNIYATSISIFFKTSEHDALISLDLITSIN